MNSKEFNKQIFTLAPRIYPMVLRLLQSDEEAADAMQEIMLKLWNKRKKLAKHPNKDGFVFLTARNHCLDELKRKKRLRITTSDQDIPDRTDTDNSKYEQKELGMMIEKVISVLPDNQRNVVILRDLDGLEFSEIVEITGLKTEHIRVLLSRARKNIATQLTEIYSYEKGTA